MPFYFDSYEKKLEREVQGYDPWGRDGGGAPVRNKDGHVVGKSIYFILFFHREYEWSVLSV